MLTLWDLVRDVVEAVVPAARPPKPARPVDDPSVSRRAHIATIRPVRGAPLVVPAPDTSGSLARESMEQRYERVTQEMLRQFAVRVRRWRTSMSGMAWELRYADGTRKRLIESPRPRGPMSMAIFLHEIGHHAIGFDRYKPRCLEEYHAWAWSITKMRELDLNVTDAVLHRMRESLWYSVSKAKRRGLRILPPELEAFQERPPRRRRERRPAPR